MAVTGEQVWNALQSDQDFRAIPVPMQMFSERFVKALPEVLKAILNLPVDLESLMNAKLLFMSYCLDNGMIESWIDALPGPFGYMEREVMKEVHRERIHLQLIELRSILSSLDVAKLSKDLGIVEAEILHDPDVGLQGTALQLYDAGKLTIEQLLRHQPSMILDRGMLKMLKTAK